MKTIYIDKQESAAALTSAFAAALAEEIGWTADGVNVKKDNVNIYFKFALSGTTVTLKVTNGYADSSAGYVSYADAATYRLNISQTAAGSIAVGIGKNNDIAKLDTIIAQNTAGEYVGIAFSSSSTATIRGVETGTRTQSSISPFNGDGISTSIIKMPDVWGAAMYKDLYLIFSCPFRSADLTFYIGGKNYRAIGTNPNYMWMAIPEV